jgi:CRISPR-associated endonuclease/helicase Cas3
MREVIAVCRSRKKARNYVAQVLDRYLWRIGDRTWRGKASNACLDRMAKELRSRANRATAISIQEIRSSVESRMPLIRIGSRAMFSDNGLTPVSSHPSEFVRLYGTEMERNGLAVVRIAALFHDLGKATVLFQEMIKSALKKTKSEVSFIRHELFSTVVWDRLFGSLNNQELKKSLASISSDRIDKACMSALDWLLCDGSPHEKVLDFDFLKNEHSLTFAVGMLILTHHKLPKGDSDHIKILGGEHARPIILGGREKLKIAFGIPFWHEDWWLKHCIKNAAMIVPEKNVYGIDIALRGSLIFADHIGSSDKKSSSEMPDFLANTIKNSEGISSIGDSLSMHVKRVYISCRPAFDMLHRLRERLPAISEAQMPLELIRPQVEDLRFIWQMEAARTARSLAASKEGGFFACMLSGTGTGKTRAAPTILAGAAFGDYRPERRYFRMTLGLGLRVLVGSPPIEFSAGLVDLMEDPSGSESLTALPEWLTVEPIEGTVPIIEDPKEEAWLRGLSIDTDRGLPAILDRLIQASGTKAKTFRDLADSPIIVCTIDHLMKVASPRKTDFIPAAIRTLTSDLILDEVDQYSPEDIAAIARLVFQTAAGGRRVIIMSATLTKDIVESFYASYKSGWEHYSKAFGVINHVNLLLTGDSPGSIVTNENGKDFGNLYEDVRSKVLLAIERAPEIRNGQVLELCKTWKDVVKQVSDGCSRMHDLNASEVEGFKVSIGLVKMTRISHTTAIFNQLESGKIGKRLRLKLCLHSNFPQLHRSWIEDQLKRALNRKGRDPFEGLRKLCESEDIFKRADEVGVRDIEIICVTSPVIETGNDLDFDYAILDPISIRSIIQAAGRVRRHRAEKWPFINVLIIGRSLIAMQDGKLSMPGVETPLPKDTLVSNISFNNYQDRNFRDLAGNASFDKINASLILLSDVLGSNVCPLRDAEILLRKAMMDISGESPPLGRYIANTISRMNTMFTRTRVFRRSTTRNIRYALSGDGLNYAQWMVNRSFRGQPDWCPVTSEFHEIPKSTDNFYLFRNILQRAWHDYCGQNIKMPDFMMRKLITVDIPDYSNDLTIFPILTYGEQTGFTRNLPEDLFKPFGKSG